jgi:hypothetical protein
MGLLIVSRELNEDDNLMGLMWHYLKEQHEASFKVVLCDEETVSYWVEGEGIPKGHKRFSMSMIELAPKVLMFQIE